MMFEPRRTKSLRKWRFVLGFLVVAVLVAAGLGLGWMVYLTRLPDNPTPPPAQTTAQPPAKAEAPAAPAAAKPEPAQVATASPQPAPPTTMAPPEPSTTLTTTSITTTTSATTLTTVPPRAQVAAPPPALPTAGAQSGNPLIFCYQGKAPDTRLFLVDKSRQRVMVLRYLGEMTLDYEFPCSTGAQPGNKEAAGDERTPEGIYFTTHRFEDRKITIFGDRAIHLNYPNPFDQVDQRQGNGIFIHGTNQRLRPRGSNGCVVLQNEDLTILASTIQEQLTPVVVTDHLRLPDLDQRNQACQMLAGISVEALDKAEAALGHRLAIQPAPGRVPQPKEMQELEEMGLRLAGLNAKTGQVKAETQGMALYGIGEKWVVVVSQTLTGPKGGPLAVTRRFYLRGKDPRQAELLLGQWVVESTPQARMLASWAPAPPPPTPPAAPKPVEVAAAKPAPAEEAVPVKTASAPPAAAPAAAKPAPAAAGHAEAQVNQMLEAWLKAWRTKNLNAYISHYANDFKSGGMDRRQWRDHKAYLNKVYKVIAVEARDLQVKVNGNRAKVVFVQHYRSDWHQDVGRKLMDLAFKGGQWQIVSERWEEMPARSAGRRQGRS